MYNALFLVITPLLLTGCGRAIHHNDDVKVDAISNHKITDIIGKWRVVYVDYKDVKKYFSTMVHMLVMEITSKSLERICISLAER